MSRLPWVAWSALVLGCGGGGATTSPAISNSTVKTGAAASNALFLIRDGSLGPITKDTPANLTALRDLLGKDGYAVRPVHRNGVELHVFDDDEPLFYVIPNEDGTLFNVHAVSGKVEITQHPQWKIGSAFAGDDILTSCECWGSHPVCFKQGDHVAVAFERSCDGLSDERMRKVLTGVRLQRAVWSPTPFGFDGDEAPDPCGGVPGGVQGGIPGVTPDPCGP
ncbi:MAG: hypothetical protein JWP01_1019 [Myxococcales bacterium]|nr:hypothetical protein [Myxococcales bacterium]